MGFLTQVLIETEVVKKPAIRVRHIPQRTCVGCRVVLPKRDLIRLVRTQEGVKVDLSGKMAGRGAYLHNKKSCWEKGLQGTLAHALKTELSLNDKTLLQTHISLLPADDVE